MDAKTIILGTSLIVSNGLTIFLYLKNRKYMYEDKSSERLFRLQDISMKYPYLEDKKFSEGWIEFRSNYIKISPSDESSSEKYFRYEQYCEMIFNYMAELHRHYKTEDELLKQVDLKSWARMHKSWWINPLDEHSNHDSYSKEFCKIIDDWMK